MSEALYDRLQQEPETLGKTGLSMADLLELSKPLRMLINWMMRQQTVSLSEAAAFLELDEAESQARLAALIEKGFVYELKVDGEARYRVRLAPKRQREVPLDRAGP